VKDWKSCERKVAALLGGKRIPVSGRTRGDAPDILHSSLSIEVKSRKKLPGWIEDAMQQAEDSAKNGQLPAVVLHQVGCKYRDSLVVCRLGNFAEYLVVLLFPSLINQQISREEADTFPKGSNLATTFGTIFYCF
jgi:hypothetical protein